MKHSGVDYDMSEIETLVERLRGGDEALSGLVERLVDDLLSRPVTEMVEPDWIAQRFVEGLRATAQDEHTESWLHAQVKGALQRSESETGSLSTRLPQELSRPLKQLLRRPYTPNATIVRSLLDHEAMRDLIRTVLVQILTDFGKSIRPALPDAPLGGRRRGGKLSQLVGAAQEVASVVGAQVEERTEAKVREFVDDAISKSLEISVAQLCSESFSDSFGRWRADSVDVLLEVPVETWQGEIESLEPEALVGEIVELIRGLAAWDGLAGLVESLLSTAMEEVGDASLRDFLAGSGIEEDWRPQVEEILLQRARDFVATDVFSDWIRSVVD